MHKHIRQSSIRGGFVAIATLISSLAQAHVTLEQQESAVGSFYKAVFRVPHGCNGSATIRLHVEIPEGVIAVKPMVKPGWRIEVKRAAYAKPYSFLHGAKFTEGPKEIIWSGGKLPDDLYDEFVLSTFLAGDLPAGKMLYFPIVQECENGSYRWVQIPTAKDEHPDEPAPGLMLIEAPRMLHK
jgi:uncharacterized protein YcnI